MIHVTEVAKLYLGDALIVANEISNEQPAHPLLATALLNDEPVSNPRWYAVCVCPRHEKAVTANLKLRELTHFLPVYRSVRRWKDRRKELDMVLFPG